MLRRSSTHRNVFTHLTAAVVVPGCIVLCWWQLSRALSGNTLSWAYVFEWPIFAGYAVFLWWKLIHDPPPGALSENLAPDSDVEPVVGDRHGGIEELQGGAGPDLAHPRGPAGEEDEELASYNRYLAALNASNRRKHW